MAAGHQVAPKPLEIRILQFFAILATDGHSAVVADNVKLPAAGLLAKNHGLGIEARKIDFGQPVQRSVIARPRIESGGNFVVVMAGNNPKLPAVIIETADTQTVQIKQDRLTE